MEEERKRNMNEPVDKHDFMQVSDTDSQGWADWECFICGLKGSRWRNAPYMKVSEFRDCVSPEEDEPVKLSMF